MMFFMLYIWDGVIQSTNNLPSAGLVEKYQMFPLNTKLQRLI